MLTEGITRIADEIDDRIETFLCTYGNMPKYIILSDICLYLFNKHVHDVTNIIDDCDKYRDIKILTTERKDISIEVI